MKYSQLVQTPRDVEHWLENQLTLYGIHGELYSKYILFLLTKNLVNKSGLALPGIINCLNKLNIIKQLMNYELEKKRSQLHSSLLTECEVDISAMNSKFGFSYSKNMNYLKPVQPCLPPNQSANWTLDLLHDSESEIVSDKMNDHLSLLFYDNAADEFGYDYWKTLDKRMDEDADHVKFYNKQNLLPFESNSLDVNEKSTEIEKLIAKFDTNVEDIWKTSSKSDNLQHVNYQSLFSENFLIDSYLHYGPNLVWSTQQEGSKERNAGAKSKENGYASSFGCLNELASPILQHPRDGLDTMLNSFSVTLSEVKKWSAADCYNSYHNLKGNSYTDDVKPTMKAAHVKNGYLEYKTSEVIQNNNDEEDLLTSAKTHFRPIRMEELGSSQAGVYADGTTFAISNDLEKVSFKRSESGLLYLDADANTPRKYMEFKEKEGGVNKSDWDNESSNAEEFVPKFRVRQSNEKCIQTDDVREEQTMMPASIDTDCESISCASEEDEFFFPGDEELAQNIVSAVGEESGYERKNINTDCNFMSRNTDAKEMSEMSKLYKMTEIKSCVCGGEEDWNQNLNVPPKEAEWSQIWQMQTICESCRSNTEKLSLKDRYRFREELTQEGEQLLLDLSCLQQMYSNLEWCDDNSTITLDSNDEDTQHSADEMIGTSESGCPGKGDWWSNLIAKEEPVKNGFDLRRLRKEENLFTDLFRYGKSKGCREGEIQRRNSSCPKGRNLFSENQSRQTNSHFIHLPSARTSVKEFSVYMFRSPS